MGRRSRKSKRRLNSMFLAVLLSAVMLIVTTYAWFSSNRTVSIEGITAKVAAANGLQISLDGANWGSSVTVNTTTLAAADDYNDYVFPNELHPVSTTGTTLDSGDVSFFAGLVSSDGSKLTSAAQAGAADNFIVFDVYLKNASSQTSDNLQLDTNTEVKLGATEGKEGVRDTGLENSVRTGFLLYPTTAQFTAAQSAIASLGGDSPLVGIWEPNYNKHILEVATNDPRVEESTTSDFKTLGLLNAGSGTLTGIDGTDDTDFMAETKTIRTDAKLTAPVNLTAVDETGTQFSLPGNTISRMRVYIWLEGQDPDCIDTASTGKYLDFLINLAKPTV
ncbi:MAG: hypothetical protein IKG56_02715 [Clostridia bacterium]|nr:hypothetical protein [Clostridia bacterium]